MRIGGTHFRSVWPEAESGDICVIDQRALPFRLEVKKLFTAEEAVDAIRDMVVRGAPLIGVTAAFGMYLAVRESTGRTWRNQVKEAAGMLASARPTAVNLRHAVDLMWRKAEYAGSRESAIDLLFHSAVGLAEAEVQRSHMIGIHGLDLIAGLYRKKGSAVRILTHCNAGWLACVDYGTATAPIYLAHDRGIPVHVWVDETRPRNQGSRLTAYELGEHGVPHSVVTDNAGGHLMQRGEVDLVITGSDRTTRTGDVVNKIGTYLKALAARDNGVPFYAALPTTTIDMKMTRGEETEIEFREEEEVSFMEGWDMESRRPGRVRIIPEKSRAVNPGFDVTPARLVTGLITENGICKAEEEAIRTLTGSPTT